MRVYYLWVCETVPGTCVMNLSDWAPGPSSGGEGSNSKCTGLLGWLACMTATWPSPHTFPSTLTNKRTHTSFPSARHFRLIGLATATAGWGLRHGQIQCVYISMCVSVCVCCCKGTGWSLWHLSPKPNPCPPKPGGWAEPRPPVGPCTPAPTCW